MGRGWLCIASIGLACGPAPAWAQAVPAAAAPVSPAPAAAGSAPRPAPGATAEAAAGSPPAAQTIVIEARALDAAEQRRHSVVGGVVVGREELDRHGDISLLDVLQRLPGVSLDDETPQLRGMGGGATLILLNGVPAPPGFSLDSLDPGDVERIEILKGPSAEHGGVAGSINVILRQASRVRQREWRASLGYRAVAPQGSASLRWGDRVGGVSYLLPLSLSSWANGQALASELRSRPAASALGEPSWRTSHTSSQWRTGSLRLAPQVDHRLDARHSLQWQGLAQRNHNHSRQQRHTQVLAGPPLQALQSESDNHGHWQNLRGQLQWQRREPSGQRLELKALGQQTRSASVQDGLSRSAQGLPIVLRQSRHSRREDQHTIGLRWHLPWEWPGDPAHETAAHTLQAGLDLESKRWQELRSLQEDRGAGWQAVQRGSLGLPLRTQARRHTAFVQNEWSLDPALSLALGLRLEHWRWQTTDGAPRAVDEGADPPMQQRTTRQWLPVLHLRRALDAAGRDLLRASLAQTLRQPDPNLWLPRYQLHGAHPREEPNTPLAADTTGNPLLRPERMLALELALERSLGGGGALSASVFHRRIDGLIRRRVTLETVPEALVPRWVSRPANIGGAHSTGLELEVKGTARQLLGGADALPAGLRLRAALSLYRSAVEALDDPEARLEGQPPWALKLGLDHSRAADPWSAGFSLNLTPGFSTRQSDQQRVWRGPARRLDAYLAYRLDRHTQLRLAVVNLGRPDALSHSESVDPHAADAEAAAWVRSATRRQSTSQFTASVRMGF